MDNFRTRLTEGGAISIPPEYLQALGLRAGDEVILRLEDGAIYLFTIGQAIRHAQELVRSYISEGRSLADELIAERRQEVD
jgi:bifunctional DNA-binding transcriptional regulator/antitoxin component of YhaV-PrlF toxin-antitoxin module